MANDRWFWDREFPEESQFDPDNSGFEKYDIRWMVDYFISSALPAMGMEVFSEGSNLRGTRKESDYREKFTTILRKLMDDSPQFFWEFQTDKWYADLQETLKFSMNEFTHPGTVEEAICVELLSAMALSYAKYAEMTIQKGGRIQDFVDDNTA